MSEIPSDLASSIAQTGFQAREVAKERDAGVVGQSQAADRQVKAVDEADTTVDTTDSDVEIYADAEGTGSQGRSPEEEAEEADEADEAAGKGITEDDQGRLHLDLEA